MARANNFIAPITGVPYLDLYHILFHNSFCSTVCTVVCCDCRFNKSFLISNKLCSKLNDQVVMDGRFYLGMMS